MPQISAEAAETMKLVREQNLLDESSARVLEQLFSSRLDAQLVRSLLVKKEETVAVALVRATFQARTPSALGYRLRFLADLVYSDPSLGEHLVREDLAFGCRPAELFLSAINQFPDLLGVVNPAIYLTATALRYSDEHTDTKAFADFFGLARTAFTPDRLVVSDIEFMVQACVQLARRKSLRRLFFEERIVPFLPHLLIDIESTEPASITQCMYDTLLLVWLLSFEYEGIVQIVREKMIPQLHRLLQRVSKEKCVRVALLTLHNMVHAEKSYMDLVTNPNTHEWIDSSVQALNQLVHQPAQSGLVAFNKGPSLVAEMVGVGMLKTLNQLQRRKFGDDDIPSILDSLVHALEQSMETLTTFTEYRGEVLSGMLEWTPVHTSAKFWKENAVKTEDHEFEVLKAIGKLVLTARDEVTLAVVCHDLGEIVRYHPTGRSLLTMSFMAGVKERIMTLMSHPNPAVAKEALLATQKIMVQRWEYIEK